tara:strand:- start:738 stop:1679 length:942 start_codon:yes stop_codon:yes gene_type:complete
VTNQEIENITLESLRDWFKKEKWVRITTSGNIAGPCGTSKNKKNPDRCLPRAKAQSLTKAQRAATARKKKRAGAKGKTVVKNTKAATVKKEGYYENTALEQEIKQYGYENFEDFFNDNPGAEEAVFDFIDQNLARIQKETANPQDGKAAPFGSGYKPTKKMKNEKTIKEAMTKDRLLAMMKGTDDVMVRLYDGTYYIVYSPYSDNDDNASMWGDDSVIGINRDGDEREFRYDDIDDVYIYEEKEKMEIKRPSKQGIKRKLRKAFLEELVWEVLTEKDDRCTRIAKRKYDTWPSAYASGAVVRCRKGEIWKKEK